MLKDSKDIYKIVLIGDGGVGKTSLRNQFLHRRFTNNYKTTIGADFVTKELQKDGRKVILQIWDTAGQERFQSLGVAFYRGADACIMVYDVNNYLTFENLTKWRLEFLKYCGCHDPDNFPFAVIGNKVDLDDRVISKRQINAWLDKYSTEAMKYPWVETSAKLGTNVETAFQAIIDLIPNPLNNKLYEEHSKIQFLESAKYKNDREDKASSMYSQTMVQLTPAQIKLKEAQGSDDNSKRNTCCFL
ncbi:ras-domain-containing protein [Neoconidiobolus thromboides FSU 785]|nr:ras-domain-containing protein [Neoconidiobolus thromboides FSU 785]